MSSFDVDKMKADLSIWYDGEFRGVTVWELHNTPFNSNSTVTTYNETTGETVTDYSNTTSKYYHEKIFESSGITIRDAWEIKDPWQLE